MKDRKKTCNFLFDSSWTSVFVVIIHEDLNFRFLPRDVDYGKFCAKCVKNAGIKIPMRINGRMNAKQNKRGCKMPSKFHPTQRLTNFSNRIRRGANQSTPQGRRSVMQQKYHHHHQHYQMTYKSIGFSQNFNNFPIFFCRTRVFTFEYCLSIIFIHSYGEEQCHWALNIRIKLSIHTPTLRVATLNKRHFDVQEPDCRYELRMLYRRKLQTFPMFTTTTTPASTSTTTKTSLTFVPLTFEKKKRNIFWVVK